MPKVKVLFILVMLSFAILSCNALVTPTQPVVEPSQTQIIEAHSSPTKGSNIPLTEADVPRITLDEARAAIESGAAIVVDVRSTEAFAASHIPGALNIQLAEFETNPTGIDLDKDQWIITYCT